MLEWDLPGKILDSLLSACLKDVGCSALCDQLNAWRMVPHWYCGLICCQITSCSDISSVVNFHRHQCSRLTRKLMLSSPVRMVTNMV